MKGILWAQKIKEIVESSDFFNGQHGDLKNRLSYRNNRSLGCYQAFLRGEEVLFFNIYPNGGKLEIRFPNLDYRESEAPDTFKAIV